MTAPKLWSERDFDECCYPVSGVGPFTMVCAVVGRGSYCEAHRKELDAIYNATPRVKSKAAAVARYVPPPPRSIPDHYATMAEIMDHVAFRYGLTVETIKGRARLPAAMRARQEFFYEAHLIGRSYPKMAAFCGGRDHTVAIWGKRRHEARLAATRLRWDEAA